MWRSIIDPILRSWPGYPPDWERRRMSVFERASGRCERCGLPCGHIGLRNGKWRVIGAHIHHVLPIAAGGNHALENLEVRCAACHADEHPENTELRR